MRISMPFSSHAGALEEFLMRIKMANRYAMRKEKVQMRPKEGTVPQLQIFNMSSLEGVVENSATPSHADRGYQVSIIQGAQYWAK